MACTDPKDPLYDDIRLFEPGLDVTACSGSGSNDRAPVNQAPSIAAIAGQNTVANATSAPIAFSVFDEQVSSLSISASSDRQQVIPDSNLSLAGTGNERTVTATPLPDVTGDAFITIVATDAEGLSASTSFLLIVDAEQRSMQQFARDTFATDANEDPVLINAVEFAMDAEADDFADLLAQ